MVLSMLQDELIGAVVTSSYWLDMAGYRVVMYCPTILDNRARDVQVERV